MPPVKGRPTEWANNEWAVSNVSTTGIEVRMKKSQQSLLSTLNSRLTASGMENPLTIAP